MPVRSACLGPSKLFLRSMCRLRIADLRRSSSTAHPCATTERGPSKPPSQASGGPTHVPAGLRRRRWPHPPPSGRRWTTTARLGSPAAALRRRRQPDRPPDRGRAIAIITAPRASGVRPSGLSLPRRLPVYRLVGDAHRPSSRLLLSTSFLAGSSSSPFRSARSSGGSSSLLPFRGISAGRRGSMGSRGGHPKQPLKPPARALFSCGMFRNCTQIVLSPTTTDPPPPPPRPSSPPPPAPLAQGEHDRPHPPKPAAASVDRAQPSSSPSSSSSSTSQSFTQWRFPLTHPLPESDNRPSLEQDFVPPSVDDLAGAFRVAELQLASGHRVPALRLLERSLVLEPGAAAVSCPPSTMSGVVAAVLDPVAARPAAKVLLALLLAEGNRRLAVEAGAASAVVEAVTAAFASGAAGATTADRALAALELVCTVPEGAAEVRRRAEAGAAGTLVGAVERLGGRGRECAIGVLAAIYGGEWAAAAPPEVGRAVVVALQGECSARARRKGAQLLKALKENGRLDLPEDGC